MDDGVDIHYHPDDFRDPWLPGPGEVILLHHGFARSMKWWVQWVPALSRKYRVLRYDCRGCGESSVPLEGATWSVERIANDAVSIIDHLGVSAVHWVGFESGGVWGMALAATHPERIKSLTVVNTPSVGWTKGRMSQSIGQDLGTVSEAISRLGLRQWLIETNSTRLDPDASGRDLVDWHIREHSKTPTEVVAAIMRIVETSDLSGLPSKIKAPTLMMTGDRSPISPVEEQRAMQIQITNARLVVFPNIGSGINLLIPDACVAELLKFLKNL